MSKSKGNVINPWDAIATWGVDTLRFWMYSVNAPGDSKCFDEKTVREAARTLSWFEHSAKFYELSRDEKGTADTKQHVVDVWIEERTRQTVMDVTRAMDTYNVNGAVRAIALLFEDLSQWYVRRVRDRVRSGDTAAHRTLRETLRTSSLLLAPFAPFLAERVFRVVREENDPESVHLADWPREEGAVRRLFHKNPRALMEYMAETRALASTALKLRQEANVKVRQPLAALTVKSKTLKGNDEFIDLLRDEVNVKEVRFDDSQGVEVLLDVAITAELKEEGEVREVLRVIQDLRKEMLLLPKDEAILIVGNDLTFQFIHKHWNLISKTANLKSFEIGTALKGIIMLGMGRTYSFDVKKL